MKETAKLMLETHKYDTNTLIALQSLLPQYNSEPDAMFEIAEEVVV